MHLFLPDIYQKNIHKIPYQSLKKQGIKCLVFDLDNTLGLISDTKVPSDTKKLILSLKKDFMVFISTNNSKDRIKHYLDELEIEGVFYSLKPSRRGLRYISKKYNFQKNEIAMIGDQVITDILSGNRFGCCTILVEPLGVKDLKITALNRLLEKIILNHYQKKGFFERGQYYESRKTL